MIEFGGAMAGTNLELDRTKARGRRDRAATARRTASPCNCASTILGKAAAARRAYAAFLTSSFHLLVAKSIAINMPTSIVTLAPCRSLSTRTRRRPATRIFGVTEQRLKRSAIRRRRNSADSRSTFTRQDANSEGESLWSNTGARIAGHAVPSHERTHRWAISAHRTTVRVQ